MNRLSFEKWCMEIAKTVSLRSPDPKLQVGCILVSPDFKRILGWGYNGPVGKQSNERISLESGKSGFIHAELNCLLNSPPGERGYLFVNVEPCVDCCRIIANSGKVSKVFYGQEYGNTELYTILVSSGITAERLT